MNTKQFAAVLLAVSFSLAGMAQSKEEQKERKPLNEEKTIIIKDKAGKKTEKMVVIVDGDKVTINGKPVENFKDGDLAMFRNKKIIVNVHGKDGIEMNLPPFEIETDTQFHKGFLGVMTEKTDKGVRITEISKESAAEKAGLQKNDIITKINDTKIETSGDLVEAIGKYPPETKINISYLRDGKERNGSAVLGKRDHPSFNILKMDDGEFNLRMPHMPRPPFPFEFQGPNTGKPKLGIQIEDLEEGNGVKITDVDEDLPAGKAGLKEDDILTEINGKELKSVDDLKASLKDLKEGDKIKFGFKRNGKSQTVDIKLPKKLKTANL